MAITRLVDTRVWAGELAARVRLLTLGSGVCDAILVWAEPGRLRGHVECSAHRRDSDHGVLSSHQEPASRPDCISSAVVLRRSRALGHDRLLHLPSRSSGLAAVRRAAYV